jgi:hypothetical protein
MFWVNEGVRSEALKILMLHLRLYSGKEDDSTGSQTTKRTIRLYSVSALLGKNTVFFRDS